MSVDLGPNVSPTDPRYTCTIIPWTSSYPQIDAGEAMHAHKSIYVLSTDWFFQLSHSALHGMVVMVIIRKLKALKEVFYWSNYTHWARVTVILVDILSYFRQQHRSKQRLQQWGVQINSPELSNIGSILSTHVNHTNIHRRGSKKKELLKVKIFGYK